jgi:hypothetical protein
VGRRDASDRVSRNSVAPAKDQHHKKVARNDQPLPSIVWLDFSPDVVRLYEAMRERTEGLFVLVCYLTDTLKASTQLPGTVPPAHGPAQAIGYQFILTPKSIHWPVPNPDGLGRILPSMPDIQDVKPIRQEQVFVIDRGYPKDDAVRRVLLQAHEMWRLGCIRIQRMGYRVTSTA